MSERLYKTLHDEGIAETVVDSENYSEHVSAMTGEGLHSKRDIAAELAYRDIKIESLSAQLAKERGKVKHQDEMLDAIYEELCTRPTANLSKDMAIKLLRRDRGLATHTDSEEG